MHTIGACRSIGRDEEQIDLLSTRDGRVEVHRRQRNRQEAHGTREDADR